MTRSKLNFVSDMNLKALKPKIALNKAFLKVRPTRSEIENFKANLNALSDRLNEDESEEFHKNLIIDFLRKTYHDTRYFINTKGRNDLVIHNGTTAKSKVGVILEVKKPNNRAEMLSPDNINRKAFQELVLYYLRERMTHKNIEIKHLIATNIYEWYIFDVQVFDRLFAQNKSLVRQFEDFEAERLADVKTDFFYKQIAEPFIAGINSEIEFTYFNFQDYIPLLRGGGGVSDNKLISLFKLLSPEHLLKIPFANDSNSLDKRFYTELLHIIGLTEIKAVGRKLIERTDESNRNSGSILENAINQLESLDKIARLPKPTLYGNTPDKRLFGVALELSITWINRILFLKLLEAQLINYHRGDKSYAFLSFDKVKNFDDLNGLFFQVLAKKQDDRNNDLKSIFEKVPYLNSSLFEPADIEQYTLFISNLRDEKTIPLFSQTVLKNSAGKRRAGNLSTLQYLLEFLDAYDFSGEGSEEIQEDNKTLINASVLGLIFEKINGYKDGSFFTPGFITMYMCRETIRRAVVNKFNEAKQWDCKEFDELYNKIDNIKEANDIVNSLKICDPAVGSGHFLVSALNEIIAVKNDLKILQDRDGKRLKEYQVEVVNDELTITDEDGDLFEYHPQSPNERSNTPLNPLSGGGLKKSESQRVQEAFFHEKQTIIENCLFGVDINPNSVKICRLRLWIELLKSAYYKPTPPLGRTSGAVLETLPNIDINIKNGNSLVSRFALNADLKQALKKSKWTINSYRAAVSAYHNAKSKEEKREMEHLILKIKQDFSTEIRMNDPLKKRLDKLAYELYYRFTGSFLFEPEGIYKKDRNNPEKKREAEQKKLEKEITEITSKIDDIKGNKVYEQSFEWRFEFPEVLNADGDFMGFDVVLGNPPYIRQEEFAEIKPFLKERYEIYNSIADLLTYFVELGYKILKPGGIFQFIVSNKFTRTNYGASIRKFLLDKTTLTHFLDFSGIPVFDEATVDAAIIGFDKIKSEDAAFLYANIPKETVDMKKFSPYLKSIQTHFKQADLNADTWSFEGKHVLAIKQKVEAQGIPLKNWGLTINYGIKTGYNQAFVIDGAKRKELIAADPKCNEIIKPLLRGRDIQKWSPEYADLWLINTHNGIRAEGVHHIDIEDYPAIKNHLNKFFFQIEKRADKGDTPYNLRNCAYLRDFEKPKIIYPNMTKFLPFVIDLDDHFYHNDKSFHIVAERIYWLGAFFNSKLFRYCFRDNFPELLGGTRELRKVFFDKIPVKQITAEEEEPFKKLVAKILQSKKQNTNGGISGAEAEIDHLVYQIYGLTDEEIHLIENT